MQRYFVTSSGTGVGKTLVMRLLIEGFRARGDRVEALKPLISGWDDAPPGESDTGVILEALGRPLTAETIDGVSPWRFSEPLSPDMAARREGRSIPFDALLTASRAGATGDPGVHLVEGVGGVMVPLDASHTVLDWIAALGAPALLGAISHTLTAHAALREAGVAVPLVVVSETGDGAVPIDETMATLDQFLPDTALHYVSRLAADDDLGDAARGLIAALTP